MHYFLAFTHNINGDIMNLRTDLVSEIKQLQTEKISGAKSKQVDYGKCNILQVDIFTQDAAKILNRPMGKYFTLTFPRIDRLYDTSDIKEALIFTLKKLLPVKNGNIMVVGLGNTDITPDALGPLTANKIIATRHLDQDIKRRLGLEKLKSVSVLIPGVLGKTGIEASLTTAATIKSTNTTAVIVIDALAAANNSRLCTTLQLSNTGISPGSGVKNSRKELSERTLGVPVVAIGMPTVTDAFGTEGDSFMVTPKEIDLLIKLSSEIISDSLNRFLQPDLDQDTIATLS